MPNRAGLSLGPAIPIGNRCATRAVTPTLIQTVMRMVRKTLWAIQARLSAYLYNDGTNQFFRLLLEDDPRNNSGTYEAFGYGLVLDTDGVTNTYELLIILDGIASGGKRIRSDQAKRFAHRH